MGEKGELLIVYSFGINGAIQKKHWILIHMMVMKIDIAIRKREKGREEAVCI